MAKPCRGGRLPDPGNPHGKPDPRCGNPKSPNADPGCGNEASPSMGQGRGNSAVAGGPAAMEQCKNGGWRALGFRNQGLCVNAAVSHRK